MKTASEKLGVLETGLGSCAVFEANNTSYNGVIQSIFANRNTTTSQFYVFQYYNDAISQPPGVPPGENRILVNDNGDFNNKSGTYGSFSDEKLKENIVDATAKLSDVMKLKVKNYTLLTDNKKHLGFIAQEFETVFPSLVENIYEPTKEGKLKDTTTKIIKTSILVPILVKAIQELKLEHDNFVQETTSEIEKLKSEIQSLKLK